MYLNEFPNFQTKSKKRVESRQICEKKYLLSIYSAQNSNWTLEFNVSSLYLTFNRWFNEVSCFLHSTIFWLNKPSACLRLHGIKIITSLTMQSNYVTILTDRIVYQLEMSTSVLRNNIHILNFLKANLLNFYPHTSVWNIMNWTVA